MPPDDVYGRGLDDPLWEFVVRDKLVMYIPYVRTWWDKVKDLAPINTGVFEFDTIDEDQPPGLYYRFTRTSVRSPIRGIQTFPFIQAGVLQLSGVSGGSTKLIQRLFIGDRFTIDEFTCIEKHNLPSTHNHGQIIAFVPTEIYQDLTNLGRWLYFTNEELSSLLQYKITETIHEKIARRG